MSYRNEKWSHVGFQKVQRSQKYLKLGIRNLRREYDKFGTSIMKIKSKGL